jgi:hypothetical protein
MATPFRPTASAGPQPHRFAPELNGYMPLNRVFKPYMPIFVMLSMAKHPV